MAFKAILPLSYWGERIVGDSSWQDNLDTALYRNRWVAIVRGRVIGVGLSGKQARRAAKQIRPKDRPQLFFVDRQGNLHKSDKPMLNINFDSWFINQPLLQKTVEILRAQQIESYLVGGAVRDFLLNRHDIVDLDFALPGNGLAVARLVADALRAAYYPLDAERGTGRVVVDRPGSPPKIFLDFASFRGPDLTADLLDRDFTINAIALDLLGSPRLIDPAGGQFDLAQGQIKMVDGAAFQHDPVRVIRAVRQAADFDFELEAETGRALQRDAAGLARVSAERRRDELLKLVNTPAPGRAIEQLHRLGVLPHLLPEVEAMAGVSQSWPHQFDVLNHTILAMNRWADMARFGWPDLPHRYRAAVTNYFSTELAGNLSLGKLMPLALLLHDTGKPATRVETAEGQIRFVGHENESAEIARQVAHRLRLSSQAAGFVETVIRQHMRPIWLAGESRVSRRAVFRFFRDTAGRGFQAGVAVALHALADADATAQDATERQGLLALVNHLLEDYFERCHERVDPPLLLNGRDLMKELGLNEGKLIGLLLNRLKEAQAAGEVTTRAEALDFINTDSEFARYRANEL